MVDKHIISFGVHALKNTESISSYDHLSADQREETQFRATPIKLADDEDDVLMESKRVFGSAKRSQQSPSELQGTSRISNMHTQQRQLTRTIAELKSQKADLEK